MRKLSAYWNLKSGEQDKNVVYDEVLRNMAYKGSNLWILACAILIACIALNVDSTAVLIGAMLISPLMGPIVGAGYSLATYNFFLLKKSAKSLLLATIVSLTASSLYFYLSPFKDVSSELLLRTSPTIFDVLIAFFGGIVGAVSITRKDKGNPIPGVAIATALMPPLCTAGFAIATLNFTFFIGAMYLYSINCFFIGIATFLILKYLKYPAVVTENKRFDKRLRLVITIAMLVLVVPSCYLAYNLLNQKRFVEHAQAFINKEFTNKGYIVIYKNIDFVSNPRKIELAFLSKTMDSVAIHHLNNELPDLGLSNTILIVKQNTAELKSDVVSQLSKQNSNLSEKELQVTLLTQELRKYKVEDNTLFEQVKALFPEVVTLGFGQLQALENPNEEALQIVVVYSSTREIQQAKLKHWLEIKFNQKEILLVKVANLDERK